MPAVVLSWLDVGAFAREQVCGAAPHLAAPIFATPHVTFRISTWNCFGMGQGLSALRAVRAPFSARLQHHHVLSECGATDILCVQELLSREAQRFFDGVGMVAGGRWSRFRDDNRMRLRGRMTLRGSGLGIGARSLLANTHLRTLSGRAAGWDRLARKGALYTQLAFPQVVVDVMTVHLQAGYDARAAETRACQLEDLRRFIDSVGAPERPFIVCGDFNIDGLAHARGGAEYTNLIEALRDFEDLGAVGDLATFDPHPDGNGLAHLLEPGGSPQRIDYIFARQAATGGSRTTLRSMGVERFFDTPLVAAEPQGAHAWASDHYGLTASFAFG